MKYTEFVNNTIVSMKNTTDALTFIKHSGAYKDRVRYRLTDGEYNEHLDKVATSFRQDCIALRCAERLLYSNPILEWLYMRLIRRTIARMNKIFTDAEAARKESENVEKKG